MSRSRYALFLCLLIPLLVLAGVGLAKGTAAHVWQIETLGTGLGGLGGFATVALDGAGHPHIAYRDGTAGRLKYAYHDGTAWNTQTLGYAGTWNPSLALDAAGRPHIAYRDGTLKYTYYDGAAWQTTTVDSSGDTGWDASLALDAAGRPHIAYAELYTRDLKYAWYDGTSWHLEPVDAAGDQGRWASLELDSAGRPHIAYLDRTNDDLKYASRDDAGWHIVAVDTAGSVGFDTSLALDAADRPHISHRDFANQDLRYTYYDGAAWVSAVVDGEGDPGHMTSVALDAAGRPRISYYDWTSATLKHAWYDGAAWQLETVDGSQPVSYFTSLALDAAGRPHIAYYDVTNGALKYAVGDLPVPPTPTPTPPPGVAPCWMAEIDQAGASFGGWVGTAGDVNGDGYDDVLVGAYGYDNGQVDEGGVFVYYGSPLGPSTTPDWTAEGNQAGAWFGRRASTAGDVNGDGYDDIIVGAHLYDNGQPDEGRAYVYFGSTTGLSLVPDWTTESNQSWAYYGRTVGTAGDVNGDGYDDIIVGARYYDNGQTDEGMAFVYYGSPTGPGLTPDWTAESNQANAELGEALGTAGDVNGDGYDDVIVGAHYYDNGQTDEGRVYVYLGSAAGLSPVADWTAEGDQAGAHFGTAAETVGDIDDDGFDDVIIGAPYYDQGETNEGAAFLYRGSAAGLPSSPDWFTEGDQPGAFYGTSAGLAGDVNSDGFADVIVTAYLYDNGQVDEGSAYLYHGSASGAGTTPAWSDEGEQANVWYGLPAGTAGDVNGDGYADFLVGARYYDNGQTDEGRAYLYCGAGGGACDPVHDVDLSWAPLAPQVGEDVVFTAAAAGTPPFDFQWQFGDGTVGTGSPVTHAYAAAGTYNVTVVATNACGQAAANHDIVVTAPPPPPPPSGPLAIDIKPGSCPNPVQRRDLGTLPVAVLGTAALDVTTINPDSVRLQGVAPLRYSYEDVSRPMVDPPDVCSCTTEGPDGYLDLVLHFDVQAILATLPGWAAVDVARLPTAPDIPPFLGLQHLAFLPLLEKTPPGEQYVLTLTAAPWLGIELSGQDCIIVLENTIDASELGQTP